MEKNIFEGAYFGKTYKTRNGKIVRYCGKNSSMYVLEDDGVAVDYFPDGTFQTSGESEFDIVSEWTEETNEEYEDKIKSLIESCAYWEAYEDLPELFAKSFKELLDFAPEDQRTIDYCAYLIKSKKTILNEVYSVLKVDEEELEKLAYEYVDNSLPLLNGDAISCFKAGYRKALNIK